MKMRPIRYRLVDYLPVLPLALIICCLQAGRINAQNYRFEVYTIPLKGDLVNFAGRDILQDREGFFWFGSHEGLYRYNGADYKVFRHDPDDSNSLSSNQVREVLEDRNGVIWVATRLGLNRYDKRSESFQRYYPINKNDDPLKIGNLGNNIEDIDEDRDGYIWLATWKGFARLDPDCGKFRYYTIPRPDPEAAGPKYPRVYDLHPDSFGHLWVNTTVGLYRRELGTDSLEKMRCGFFPISIDNSGSYTDDPYGHQQVQLGLRSAHKLLFDPDNPEGLKGDVIRGVLEGSSGVLWISTDEAIHGYNKYNERVFKMDHGENYTWNPQYDFARTMYEDNRGSLWFYSREGIHQIIRKPVLFNVMESNPVANNYMEFIHPEENGSLLLGTLNGLFHYDRMSGRSQLIFGNIVPITGQPNRITAIHKDRHGIYWIGTYYLGLLKMEMPEGGEPKISIMKTGSQGITDPALDFLRTRYLMEDREGRVWISPKNKKPVFYDYENKRFISLRKTTISGKSLPGSFRIWMETDPGIFIAGNASRIFKIIPPLIKDTDSTVKAADLVPCRGIDNSGNEVPISNAVSLHIDMTGNLWIGTILHGLYKLEKFGNSESDQEKFSLTHFTTHDGIPSNTVNNIQEDSAGNLWMGTGNGLTQFSPASVSFTNYFVRHGLPHNTFRENSSCVLENGEMLFGTLNGLVSFHPESILRDPYIAPVYLTGIRVNNKLILPGENSLLHDNISFTEDIGLKYNQNNLSFDFAILNYIEPDMNQYRYKLEGFQEDWIYSGNRNNVDFTNLKPGSYTFRVAASNNEGVWNEKGTSLGISISPPPWKTWWAYTVYVLLLSGAVFWYRRYLIKQAELRAEVEVERLEKEKLREMDHMRSRFFANISHEFRTPLTLILGPVEDLLKKKLKQTSISRATLGLLQRNARRLQNLINQLLDLSRIETGRLSLQVSEGNMVQSVRTLVLSFLSLAQSKNIQYHHKLPAIDALVYFDQEKLEKILTNLISNAFKFTPSGGSVHVSMKYIEDDNSKSPYQAIIEISDTGKGIKPEHIERIFDRFYQVSYSDTREQEGSGIGLALTRELVSLYRGTIEVESSPGKGSIFRINLPVSRNDFKENEFVSTSQTGNIREAQLELDENGIQYIDETSTGKENEKLILVVEDHPDLRQYISDILKAQYRISQAQNGREGLMSTIEQLPDLVISDIMMPVMDGVQMCRKMKADERTNHIPVVMLTARADMESKLEGLETGVDDYLVKPFDADELLVRTKNLINQREILKNKFRTDFVLDSSGHGTPEQDNIIRRLIKTAGQHIDEPDFNIDRLASELNMGRTQFYRKVNAITGLTPNEFLKMIRMKHAARLLRLGKDNVAQVMYQVGMQNTAHFAKSFRKYHGVNPSEYRQSVKQK